MVRESPPAAQRRRHVWTTARIRRILPGGRTTHGSQRQEDRVPHDPLRDLRADGRHADGRVAAATVNWVTQASFKPPLVAVAVKADSARARDRQGRGAFALNVLGKGQQKLAFAFFKPAELQGRHDLRRGVPRRSTGAPILENAPAYLECPVVNDGRERRSHHLRRRGRRRGRREGAGRARGRRDALDEGPGRQRLLRGIAHAGGMFALTRKRFVGSYTPLSSRRRA